jgi:hypothetical protein
LHIFVAIIPADHISTSVRAWYSTKLHSNCASTNADVNLLQNRITCLEATRDGLLSGQQSLAWKTRRLCLTNTLQLQAYGATATLRFQPDTARTAAADAAQAEIERMPRHKAVALALFDRRAPLLASLTRPHAALTAARATGQEEEAREEARRRQEREALDEQTEALFRLRRPDRDRNGRPVFQPPAGARTAREVYSGRDPRQVDRALLRRGAGRHNVAALLAARARAAAGGEQQGLNSETQAISDAEHTSA